MPKQYIENGEKLNFDIASTDLSFSGYTESLNYNLTQDSIVFDEYLSPSLNFSISILLENTLSFIDSIENLNFNISPVGLSFSDYTESLNYDLICPRPAFSTPSYPCLNFRVIDYDAIWIIYKILMDFIEDYTLGDIFAVSTLVNGVVDFIENYFTGEVF